MLLWTAHGSHNCDKFCPLVARPAILSAAVDESFAGCYKGAFIERSL